MNDLAVFQSLGAALAVGLLLGAERGWAEREREAGTRVAGLRTFTLAGLLGGVAGQETGTAGALLVAVLALALTGSMLFIYWRTDRARHDVGVTTLVALMLALTLGLLAGRGGIAPAIATAVVAAMVLHFKPELHRGLERIERRELVAALQLLLVSAVVLPLLPDQGMGPWDALNPFKLWLFVVLVSGLSFLGYAATRYLGTDRGIAFASFCGGLVSSTALTLTFARAGREDSGAARPLAAGILIACTIMLLRVAAIALAAHPPLMTVLSWPIAAMVLVNGAAAGLLLARSQNQTAARPVFQNPFEIIPALQMGAVVAAVMLASKALHQLAGDAGLYVVALAAGLADVDAITISAAQLAGETITVSTAAITIVLAVAANTVVKASMVAAIARGRLALLVGGALTATLAAGAVALYLAEIAR